MNLYTDYFYNSLPDSGKIMVNRVDRWWKQGCMGPDPRGVAPSTDHVYCYITLSWTLRSYRRD